MKAHTFRMKRTPAVATALFLFLLLLPVYSLDPVSYSVPLQRFHDIVYIEEHSLYTLKVRGEVFKGLTTPWQKVIRSRRRGNLTTLVVRTGSKNAAHRPGNSERYLKDTRFLNLKSKAVRTMAAGFKKDASIIQKVEKHVHGYIKDVTTGIPLIPARNVIDSRSGDCTEFTVLTVALLRAKKIPARAVVGLILVPEFKGKKNVLVYHMWAEAWHKGRWHLVDSTRPGRKRLNRYIALAYHSLASEMPMSYFRAIAAIQNIEVFYSGEVKVRR